MVFWGVVVVDSDFNSHGNVSNWDIGRKFVRKGQFDDANRCFNAELNHSNSPNTFVYNDHGHLFNMMGRYDDAIDKFDSCLNSFPDYASSLFGKGISYIGLNQLNDALSEFKKATVEDENHADAWFYSAIIYANPFCHKYNPVNAKKCYENYENSREFYIKNREYFSKPFDDLSWEDVHSCFKVSSLFHLIEQFLERGNIDEFDNFFKDYRGLYYFNNEDLDKQSDIFRLFKDDTDLVNKIKEFNHIKKIEDKFESVGFEEDLIDDLTSRFGGLSFENKEILVKFMDYSKSSQLSFKDINDLIRENVSNGHISFDSFNKNKEDIVEVRIKVNNHKIKKSAEKKEKELNEKIDQLNDEINKLNNEIGVLSEKKEFNQDIQRQKEGHDLKKEIKNTKYLMNDYSEKVESYFRNNYKNLCSKNIVSGINNEDYNQDLEGLKEKYDISEKVFTTFVSAFEKLDDDNFEEAYNLFEGITLKDVSFSDELKKYLLFLDVTLLSRKGNIEEAYKKIKPFIKEYKKEMDEIDNRIEKVKKSRKNKEEKDKELKKLLDIKMTNEEKNNYLVGWFNFGNICFDYANSQSFKDSKEVYDLAFFCYDSVISSLKNQEKLGYEFNFKEGSEETFKENIIKMTSQVPNVKSSKKIYDDFKKNEKKQEKIYDDFKKNEKKQEKIYNDLEGLKKNINSILNGL